MSNEDWWIFLANGNFLLHELKQFNVEEKIAILKLFKRGKKNGQKNKKN